MKPIHRSLPARVTFAVLPCCVWVGQALAGTPPLSARELVVVPGLRSATYVAVDPAFDYASCAATPRPMDLRCDLFAEGGFDAEGKQYAVRMVPSADADGPVRSEIWRTTLDGGSERIAYLDARGGSDAPLDARVTKVAVDPVRGVLYAVVLTTCGVESQAACAGQARSIEIAKIEGLRPLASVLADESGPAVTPPATQSDTRSGDVPAESAGGTWGPGLPLPIEDGGTGASSVLAARARLKIPSTWDIVHPYGDETISGTKTFTGSLLGARVNGIHYAALFPTLVEALNDLPLTGGVLQVEPDRLDATPFADVNPAGPSTGRPRSLVIDYRNGGARFLSSMPEYPSGSAGAIESRVPFVFQVRWDDPAAAGDPGSSHGEWNCGRPGTWGDSCPSGESTWGSAGGSRQYWYSGQCNAKSDSWMGDSAICGGPHIFEVRYPEQPGVHSAKPVFAVGNGGAALFAPDVVTNKWRSYLTMFRGEDGLGEPTKANTPMYTFDRGGASFDGGFFVGSTQVFPEYTQHSYDQFNVWIAHDIAYDKAALVVEGPSASEPEAQTAALVRYLDRSGKGSYVHPGLAREAFGFYNNSRLYLGSFRDDPSADPGQLIEWEGTTVDGNTTRLRAVEPTAQRDVYLPDRSGVLLVAPSAFGLGPMLWGEEGKTGDEVCAAAGLACSKTRRFGDRGSLGCGEQQNDDFAALCVPSDAAVLIPPAAGSRPPAP